MTAIKMTQAADNMNRETDICDMSTKD